MWDMEPVSVRLRGISFLCPKYYVLSELTDLNFKMEVSCSMCGILVLKKNMNRHQLKHKEHKEEKCYLCDKPFKTKNSLNQHLKTNDKPIDIQCPYKCGIFHSKSALKNHINVKHERITYSCPYCKG